MILGLDVSTTTVGWAFCCSGSILDAGFIDIQNFQSAKDKSFHAIYILEKNPLFNQITSIHLESALSGFAGGFTSQQVIIKLSKFNAVFEYIISERWSKQVILLNVNTARKKVLGKCRQKGIPSKEFVKCYLEKIVDIHKFDVFKKTGNPDKRNADTYDAILLSLY
jgi:hypothetical protein